MVNPNNYTPNAINIPIPNEALEKRVEPIQEGPSKEQQKWNSEPKKDFKKVMEDKKDPPLASKKEKEGKKSDNIMDLAGAVVGMHDLHHLPEQILAGAQSKPLHSIFDVPVALPPLAPHSSKEENAMPIALFQEQLDHAAIPPPPVPASMLFTGVAAHVEAPARAQLAELVDQIATVIIQKTDGNTMTTMVLREPPIFAGVTVTITAFGTAPGEFNIALHNLTQAGKAMLDLPQNQLALQQGFDARNVIVHIVVTSTLENKNIPEAATNNPFAKNEGESNPDQQKEEKSNKKNNG